MKRRKFIKSATLGSIAGIFSTGVNAQMLTPREVEGPFYPITPQKDKDADLTQIAGKSGRAKGTIIDVFGQVFDQDGNQIEDVTIDLWQANSYGKYHHPHDNSEAPIDPNFQGWAILQSGKQGRFKFKTVMPGAYPLNSPQQRTPHIHIKISKYGYESILTQLYFPDQPLNQKDGLFRRQSKQAQEMMTAQKTAKNNEYRYDIYLQKIL